MAINSQAFYSIKEELKKENVSLVAVSKTKSPQEILELYNLGQRDFGENYVQELAEKYEKLPKDIRWHFIGHLQSNKVKYISSFVQMIQSVDSLKILKEINKQAKKNDRVIECLLQVHIATEETKFGLDEKELKELLESIGSNKTAFENINVRGLMGMASFSEDMEKVKKEFRLLKNLFNKYSDKANRTTDFSILSMGMSGDYKLAIQEGSNMVRIGSLLFGAR